MEDDRPIKPDQKYLEEAENKFQEGRKKIHSYLKKNNQGLLPCHLHLHESPEKQQKNEKRQKSKTKAQEYDELKKKNKSKFGEWKSKREKREEEEKKKKIDPKKMTVNYKPKKLHIDTQEYKKQGYTSKRVKKDHQNQDKMEYEKMITYMKKEMVDLEEQRQKFNQEKQSLKFKKAIEQKQGFLDIRSKVNDRWEFKKQNHNESNKREKRKSRMMNEKDKFEDNEKDFKIFSLSIDKIHECPKFDLNSIYTYLDRKSILFYNNVFYREGINKAESERNNGKVQNFEDKRISQFSDGWYEIWYPGNKRILGNKEYKVVWFSNGDVKQTFPNKYETYYCQKTKVVQIQNEEKQKIWYFPEQDQLERDINKKRQVIFSDGRHQMIQIE